MLTHGIVNTAANTNMIVLLVYCALSKQRRFSRNLAHGPLDPHRYIACPQIESVRIRAKPCRSFSNSPNVVSRCIPTCSCYLPAFEGFSAISGRWAMRFLQASCAVAGRARLACPGTAAAVDELTFFHEFLKVVDKW